MKNYTIRQIVFPVGLIIVTILTAGIFLFGCATYKATLPDGTILENCAMKELTSLDVNGKPVVQRVVFPVQNKDMTAIINSLNNILLPWLTSPMPITQDNAQYGVFYPAKVK